MTAAPARAPSNSATPLVVVDKVNKFFGDLHVLHDLDLTVDRGEVLMVIGPSGSGKSTLIRCINRLEPVTSGTITIDGVALPEEGKALARLRADVGMVFQSFNLFAHKTILQNVTMGPIKVRKLSKADAKDRAMKLLERVGHRRQGRSGARPSSPAASSSGPPSPGPWPWNPSSCSSTSPPRPSTRR